VGMEPVTVMIAARLTPEQAKMLDDLCRQEDRSRSYILRRLIEQAYKKNRRNSKPS